MKAKALPECVSVLLFVEVDGEWIAETSCENYSQYRRLPDAIECSGVKLGKTGWSSDTNRACYKQNAFLGTRLDTYA